MLVGILADTHDHLDHMRTAVEVFNQHGCEVVLFAGDFVSTICVPPLRKLNCPVVATYGDNDGNKIGLKSGFTIIGTLEEPPVRYVAEDGTRFVIVHMLRQLRGYTEEFDVAVYGHTHKPRVHQDEQGRLYINPGEAAGWTFRRPTVALFDTQQKVATVIDLAPDAPPH
ncbi:MAG: YfcE family phosphodiesterase [Planctomycetaceae bacterium]|nr:YfcE family phosphodiesterase [Planctomycetaceae bacterium]